MVLRLCRLPRPARFPRSLLSAALALPLAAIAGAPGDAIRGLEANTWLTRTVTLAELGFTAPVVMNHSDSRHEFYLPVPRNVPLADASIAFDSHYIKTEEGRTSLLLSVDGRPAFARRFENGEGEAARALAVERRARESGFVRLGVNWSSNTAQRLCEIDRPLGNALTIQPSTRLSYRYDGAVLPTLEDAWVSLPANTTILFAANRLDRAAFDAAWRIGVALENGGKRATMRAFPAPGDIIDTRELSVPAGLRQVPAFAVLDASAQHRIGSEAELGALLVLGAPAVAADLAVVDTALQARLKTALDALAAQLQGDADAARAFAAWRASRAPLAGASLSARQIQLTMLGGRPVIAVAPDAGTQAAGILNGLWRRTLDSRKVEVRAAMQPDHGEHSATPLSSLGNADSSFDVIAHGDWTANFPLSAAAIDGRAPSELVVDVAAAPGASGSPPVVSVFWNDVLLAARQIEANGHRNRLVAQVPGYALNVRNVLRVSFQRQPVSVDCNETPQGYPVSVLPSSHLRSGATRPDGSFASLLPLMAGRPQLIVPEGYLLDAGARLAQVVRLAAASGLSPYGAELVLIGKDQAARPTRPFLAMDVRLQGIEPKVRVPAQGHLQINGREMQWLDVAGVAGLGAAEVIGGSGHDGILWQAMGAPAGSPGQPFVFNRGNVMVVGADGPRAWLDSAQPDSNPAEKPGLLERLRRMAASHLLILGFGSCLAALLLFAYLASRARRAKP
ncbi:hypothetical protein P3W85_12405 [Cupriavidus basilensis]|uniref:Cyclic di-GMP-binding protein n=1 Tax=Cupriavidus basilensis TaxID=68895 RepID=A0ABT6AMA0_9BURK|nr:hypothetical protein [Cupriavidus basilensis]MDF3833744.1 hypothetical protein [Cupriavidus basilensis]